jgi:hypothetical protein
MKRHALSASSIRDHLLLAVFDRADDATPARPRRAARPSGKRVVPVGKSRKRSAAIDVSGSRASSASTTDRIESATRAGVVDRDGRKAVSPDERVRHRFAISHAEYELLNVLKARMSWIDRPTKRGELLRAGLMALSALSDAELRAAVDRLPMLRPVKPGAKKRSNA